MNIVPWGMNHLSLCAIDVTLYGKCARDLTCSCLEEAKIVSAFQDSGLTNDGQLCYSEDEQSSSHNCGCQDLKELARHSKELEAAGKSVD